MSKLGTRRSFDRSIVATYVIVETLTRGAHYILLDLLDGKSRSVINTPVVKFNFILLLSCLPVGRGKFLGAKIKKCLLDVPFILLSSS